MSRYLKYIVLALLAAAVTVTVACSHKPPARFVTLTWEQPRITGHPIVRYNVYRSTTSGNGFMRIASNVAYPWCEDAAVSGGRTYYYVVTALDPVGRESRASGEIKVFVP